MTKKVYRITLTDTATYEIKSSSKEDAEWLALDWFSEREPKVVIEEVEDESGFEYEI